MLYDKKIGEIGAMMRLDTIELSNIRKFGKDVKIEFGEGATILVAPNGTGKTTVFEAVELAVTGGIRRVDGQMGAVVNDQADQMSVRLLYSNGKTVQVALDKNGLMTREGNDIREILEVSKEVSIPYLFRMTHLLEQSSKNWFVGCDENEAGRLLGNLPLGRDLQDVLAKKTGVLKAFTSFENKTDTELRLKEKNLGDFEELLKAKEQLQVSMPHMELTGLMEKIRNVVLKYEVELDVAEDKLDLLYGEWELVKNKIVQQRDTNSSMINRLLAFQSKIDIYTDRQVSITKIKNSILERKQRQKEKEKESEKISEQKIEFLGLLNKELETEQRVNQSISNFNTIAVKQQKVKEQKVQLDGFIKELNDITLNIGKQNEIIDTYLNISDQHKILQEKIRSEKEILIEQKKREQDLQDWREKQLSVLKYQEMKLQVQGKIDDAKIEFENAAKEAKLAEQNYEKAKDNLNSLRKSEEENLAALSVIRKKIVPATKICPVCQAEYDYGELDRRISEALKGLNPVLENAVIEEESANAKVVEKKELLKQAESRLESLNVQQKNLQNELEELTDYIEKIRKRVLVETGELDIEQIIVKRVIEEQNKKITELQNKKDKLPVLNEEENQRAEEAKHILERRYAELKQQITSIEIEVENESRDISFLKKSLGGVNQDNIVQQKEQNAKIIKSYKSLITKYDQNLDSIQMEINELKKDIVSNEDEEVLLNAAQMSALNEWREFGIGDNPEKSVLENEMEKLKEKEKQLKVDLQDFYSLQDELSLWKGCQDRKNIEEKLRKQTEGMDMEQYHQMLKDEVEKKRSEIINIQEKRNALNNFYGEIMEKSEEMQVQFGAINDIWKKLLKQMAMTSLITSAPLLENKMSHNKTKAWTKASIHDEKVDVVKMASEGQITDLQLSFMLAMVSKYSWTHWKALFLDDPMQHHDLVHTSAVLDVLRDYIADFGYQIMLSTHDFLQADYFARKFGNDGIDCKIYQLVPKEGGVVADKIR